jgi:hypothetical protein
MNKGNSKHFQGLSSSKLHLRVNGYDLMVVTPPEVELEMATGQLNVVIANNDQLAVQMYFESGPINSLPNQSIAPPVPSPTVSSNKLINPKVISQLVAEARQKEAEKMQQKKLAKANPFGLKGKQKESPQQLKVATVKTGTPQSSFTVTDHADCGSNGKLSEFKFRHSESGLVHIDTLGEVEIRVRAMRYYRGERMESEITKLTAEPWPLNESIFAPRALECESQSLFNSHEVANRAANTDWLRMLQKPSFSAFLSGVCAQAAHAASTVTAEEQSNIDVDDFDEEPKLTKVTGKTKSKELKKAAKTVIAKNRDRSDSDKAKGARAAGAAFTSGKFSSMIDELRMLTVMGGDLAKGGTHPAMMFEQLKRKLTTSDKSRAHAHITTIFELYAIFSEEGDGFDIRLKEYRRMMEACNILDKETGCGWPVLQTIFQQANEDAEATQELKDMPIAQATPEEVAAAAAAAVPAKGKKRGKKGKKGKKDPKAQMDKIQRALETQQRNSEKDRENTDESMLRYEFVEAVVRIAVLKYLNTGSSNGSLKKGPLASTPAKALLMILNRNIIPAIRRFHEGSVGIPQLTPEAKLKQQEHKRELEGALLSKGVPASLLAATKGSGSDARNANAVQFTRGGSGNGPEPRSPRLVPKSSKQPKSSPLLGAAANTSTRQIQKQMQKMNMIEKEKLMPTKQEIVQVWLKTHGTPPLDICVRQHAVLESNAFRLTRLYLHSVDVTLKKYKSLLTAVFLKFTTGMYEMQEDESVSVGVTKPFKMTIDGWLAFVMAIGFIKSPKRNNNASAGEPTPAATEGGNSAASAAPAGLQWDNDFTVNKARLCFVRSKMGSYNEMNRSKTTCLSFVEFLEAVCRMAELKALPTLEQINLVDSKNVIKFYGVMRKVRAKLGSPDGGKKPKDGEENVTTKDKSKGTSAKGSAVAAFSKGRGGSGKGGKEKEKEKEVTLPPYIAADPEDAHLVVKHTWEVKDISLELSNAGSDKGQETVTAFNRTTLHMLRGQTFQVVDKPGKEVCIYCTNLLLLCAKLLTIDGMCYYLFL